MGTYLRQLAELRRLSRRTTGSCFAGAAASAQAASRALPQTAPKQLPITIGVGEPFTTTLTVAAYFALLFALPCADLRGVCVRDPGSEPERATHRGAGDGRPRRCCS